MFFSYNESLLAQFILNKTVKIIYSEKWRKKGMDWASLFQALYEVIVEALTILTQFGVC